jgi:UDP-N-acetylglucosamine--N-acetylmuramyl-(pentapeptide) pyrophosphoryl-undecaprenol N-acetylglucosamine transferase
MESKKIIKEFNQMWLSAPVVLPADRYYGSMMGIPTVSRTEFLSWITNKLLSKKADAICVAYENLERFSKRKNDFNRESGASGFNDIESKE